MQLLIYPKQSAPAVVESLNRSRLSAQLSAVIKSMPVRVGDLVEVGQLLVLLDCREYVAQRDSQLSIRQQYKLQLKLAESQLQRSLNLRQSNSISEEKVELSETELNVLRAQAASQQQQLNQAQLLVERCRVVAPYAGVVRQRLANRGELASIGTALLELQQLDQLEVVAQLRPTQAEQLPGELMFDYRGQQYPLVVRRALPLLDESSRTQQLRLQFRDRSVPPGVSGRISWRSKKGYLPADLLIRRAGQLGVMLLDGDQAVFHRLDTAIEGQPVLIELPLDKRLVVEGRQGLQAGDLVLESR
ncbi:MAG: efflux RND transporter periplasmic adaptor subunit [Halopseudomonas sp.]